jgi:hypothetical protein
MFFVQKIERKIDFVKVDKYRKIYGKYLQLLFTSLDGAVNQLFILKYTVSEIDDCETRNILKIQHVIFTFIYPKPDSPLPPMDINT